GSWLYGVAYRTALRARAAVARRQAREKQLDALPHPAVIPAEAQDWRPLLDGELERLPEEYRAAGGLCGLEGRAPAGGGPAGGPAAGGPRPGAGGRGGGPATAGRSPGAPWRPPCRKARPGPPCRPRGWPGRFRPRRWSRPASWRRLRPLPPFLRREC